MRNWGTEEYLIFPLSCSNQWQTELENPAVMTVQGFNQKFIPWSRNVSGGMTDVLGSLEKHSCLDLWIWSLRKSSQESTKKDRKQDWAQGWGNKGTFLPRLTDGLALLVPSVSLCGRDEPFQAVWALNQQLQVYRSCSMLMSNLL